MYRAGCHGTVKGWGVQGGVLRHCQGVGCTGRGATALSMDVQGGVLLHCQGVGCTGRGATALTSSRSDSLELLLPTLCRMESILSNEENPWSISSNDGSPKCPPVLGGEFPGSMRGGREGMSSMVRLRVRAFSQSSATSTTDCSLTTSEVTADSVAMSTNPPGRSCPPWGAVCCSRRKASPTPSAGSAGLVCRLPAASPCSSAVSREDISSSGVLGGGVLGGSVPGGGVLGGGVLSGGVPGGGVPGGGVLGGGVLSGGVLGGGVPGGRGLSGGVMAGDVVGGGVLGGCCDDVLAGRMSESCSLSERCLVLPSCGLPPEVVLRNSSPTPRGAVQDSGRYSLVKEADRLISTCWGFLGRATPPSFLERTGVQRWVRAVGEGGSCLPVPLALAASISSSCGWMCRLRRSWEVQCGCLPPCMMLSLSWDPPE